MPRSCDLRGKRSNLQLCPLGGNIRPPGGGLSLWCASIDSHGCVKDRSSGDDGD